MHLLVVLSNLVMLRANQMAEAKFGVLVGRQHGAHFSIKSLLKCLTSSTAAALKWMGMVDSNNLKTLYRYLLAVFGIQFVDPSSK
jgi:hypothetical protein